MDWEARYQDADTPWERGAAAPPLVGWLARNQMAGRVLVPGCGSGNDVRALARTGAEVVGLDIAPSAVARAQAIPRVANERFVVDDLFALPPEFHGAFDVVFEHTCFCAIDPSRRADYVEAVAQTLRPRGQLLAVFYLDPNVDEGPPFGVTTEELEAWFGPRFETIESYVPAMAFPGREGRELVRRLRRRD